MTQNKSFAVWLLSVCALLVAMIVIGAITRLTESGLSIVDWHAAKDMLPPLNNAAWQKLFAEYQTSPEFIQKNSAMTVDDFKSIYFWEWLHRLLGRVIGLAYALPLAYFWLRKRIPQHLKSRFIAFLFLGALQGAIGWYMVKSGLVHEPRVSHFRLALHLVTAFLLLSLLWGQALSLWTSFVIPSAAEGSSLLRQDPSISVGMTGGLKKHFAFGFTLLVATMIWGAFTAGLDAGLACSDFPKTCAQWLPSELFFQNAFLRNIVHDAVSVQFVHRVLGTVTFVVLFSLGIRFIKTRTAPFNKLGLALHLLILLQWALGIGTIQTHVMIGLAVAHQLVAVAVLLTMVSLLVALHRMNKSRVD